MSYRGRGREIVRHVRDAVRLWPHFARITDVSRTTERRMGRLIASRVGPVITLIGCPLSVRLLMTIEKMIIVPTAWTPEASGP
jgi:hypothetical protein